MLNRLVAVRILPHVHYLHFTHFVNHAAAFHSQFTWDDKDGIHHRVEFFLASHQVDKSLRVVEYAEAPVPAIPFAKFTAPVHCIEIRIEYAFVVFANHQFAFRMIDILVVQRVFLINVDFALRFTEFLA